MTSLYAPLDMSIRTPRLSLLGATDDLLSQLLPAVRAGVASVDEAPFDDPMSLYADNPERELRWIRSIWSGRASVSPDFWRLYFVVVVDGRVVGMQDLIGLNFDRFGTVTSFSWLAAGARGQGFGTEMREAILHLAFTGMNAREAESEAFFDNPASNRVSEKLGYETNGLSWASRRGENAQLQRWRLTRESWQLHRRDDIELSGVGATLSVLGLSGTDA